MGIWYDDLTEREELDMGWIGDENVSMEDMESVTLKLWEKRKPNGTRLDWLEAVEEEEQEKTQSVSYNGYGYHIFQDWTSQSQAKSATIATKSRIAMTSRVNVA